MDSSGVVATAPNDQRRTWYQNTQGVEKQGASLTDELLPSPQIAFPPVLPDRFCHIGQIVILEFDDFEGFFCI